MTGKIALSRRQLLRTGLGAPLLAVQSNEAKAALTRDSIYQRLGVRTYINAYGTITTLGGTLMLPEVKPRAPLQVMGVAEARR